MGPGGPGVPGSRAARHVGPGRRAGVAALPPSLPVLRHCPRPGAPDSGPLPQPPAQVRGVPGPRSPARAGLAESNGRRRRALGPSLTAAPHPAGLALAPTEDGAWTSWSRWSSCSEPCGGCHGSPPWSAYPPQNGGRTCAMLPGPPSTRRPVSGRGGGHGREEGGGGVACPRWGPTRNDLFPGPCPQDGCPSCHLGSGELVFHACAPAL